MIRKLLLPAFAIATLAGCATGYGYQSGAGDYYYGRPQVEYGQYGGYAPYGGYVGGGYYGGRYYGSLGYGYPSAYGYPYGYGYGYGYGYPAYGYPYHRGYPYAGYPYYPRPPRGDGDNGHPTPPDNHSRDHERLPPWRRIGQLPPRDMGQGGMDVQRQVMAQPQGSPPRAAVRPALSPRVPSVSGTGVAPRQVERMAAPSRAAASSVLRSERITSDEP